MIGSFIYDILEYCNIDALIEREQYHLNNADDKYNLRVIAENNSGMILSEEHKDKISNSLKGKIPENLSANQHKIKKKVGMYEDKILIQEFESCVEAAKHINMKPNAFSQYIGRNLKSKYYPSNISFDYL
jgi:hypothetical protein